MNATECTENSHKNPATQSLSDIYSSSDSESNDIIKVGDSSLIQNITNTPSSDNTGNPHTLQGSSTNQPTSTQMYKDNLIFQRRGIHIGNLNIRHLKPKVDDVKVFLNKENNVDIFGVCETFLNKTIDTTTLNIDGFKIERKDREDCNLIETNNGGGIVIYIGNHINYVRRTDLETQDIESMWIEIRIKNSNSFLVCSVYRPPSAKTDWLEQFSKQIESATSTFSEIYLMGDFNINIDTSHGEYTNLNWKNIIELNDLKQLIKVPTRVTAHSEKNIDHVYASDPSNVVETFVPYIAVSGLFHPKSDEKSN